MIILFFFCSGATALVYEVLWSKYLSLLFGSTIQAQTVVLAVFMSGLALGNKLFSRHADVARQPLWIYGAIELAIGIYALLFSGFYALADHVFVGVGSRIFGHIHWLLFLKGILSIGLLLVPTVLMGGTLPVLAAWLKRNTEDAPRRSARFYAVNTYGAVVGAFLSGFVLVQWLGMQRTMYVAGIVNLLIGAGVLFVSGSQSMAVSAPEPTGAGQGGALPAPASSLFRWSCVLVALTGAVSMGLEVLASRCLALVFGASLQVFAIVLIAFILGIGVGSARIAAPRPGRWRNEVTTVVLLLLASGMIAAVVWNIENLFRAYGYVESGLNHTIMGYRFHQVIISVASIAILGLPAAVLGAVLPLWIRALSETSDPLGDRVGRLLTWNTLGAMAGSLATGFVLMPGLGLRGAFVLLAALLGVAALAASVATRQRVAAGASVLVTCSLVYVALTGDSDWRNILSSGIFRTQFKDVSVDWIRERRATSKLLFYEDAADATVSVEVGPSPFSLQEITLRINGKADASSAGDLSTQILLAQLPLMVKPDSKDVFCFGMGSGVTAGSTLGYPIEHLTVADNCAPVLRAARLFDQFNNGVLTNNRVRICREDARTVLKLDPQQYDVIIAEPSNPWTVGIGSVFSRDFYQIAASRLKPGGIMTQWFHVYEIDDDILALVLRTFGSVFPYMEIWDVDGGDIVLLGSERPWKSSPEVYRMAYQLPLPASHLASVGLISPDAALARQLASQRTAFAVAGPGRIQTDDRPILEYDAPKAFYLNFSKTSVMLQNYDERTWQMDLAAPWKLQTLSRLDDATLAAVFQRYASVVPILTSYVHMRVSGMGATESLLSVPCVFQGTNASFTYAPEAARTNAILYALVQAEAELRSGSSNAPQVLVAMTHMLTALKNGNYSPKRDGWSVGYYVGAGVKAGLRIGSLDEARQILVQGLELEPDSPELRYLARVLDREGVLPISQLPSLAGQ